MHAAVVLIFEEDQEVLELLRRFNLVLGEEGPDLVRAVIHKVSHVAVSVSISRGHRPLDVAVFHATDLVHRSVLTCVLLGLVPFVLLALCTREVVLPDSAGQLDARARRIGHAPQCIEREVTEAIVQLEQRALGHICEEIADRRTGST
ncbi:hypothetical protein PHMEG_0009629 [Phytophthora megakarya]|uniref:Uncharacterized protein n=1 Tax=Phytophthora megakarya TaxID=4795 RepID=A0A225WHR8_9STRA|nr:hypothetical protein PHMEG_0009629 [Phytophthora megakarya]